VQGQLRKEHLHCVIDSECGHCHRAMELEIDSDLHYRVSSEGAEPYVYSPLLDIQKLEPSIIDGF
jgi:hypothetical protein